MTGGCDVGVRDDVLRVVARQVTRRVLGHPVRVGVDGVCGAGKTTFAREASILLDHTDPEAPVVLRREGLI